MEAINERTTAFLIRSRIDYSICGLGRYLDNEHKGIDCNEIKKNFISLSLNGININKVLHEYLEECIKHALDKDDDLPEDIDEVIDNNIDIFFDISYIDDDSVFIERAVIS